MLRWRRPSTRRGKARDVLRDRLSWNDEFISASLVPDIIAKVNETQVLQAESAVAYRRGINESVLPFEFRVEQYVGAMWTTEESAVKEAGKGTGIMVNFAGADDDRICEGCMDGISGNPWLIDAVPVPGMQNCLGNCRHAIQIIHP